MLAEAPQPGSGSADQSGYRCRLEWGARGARAAAERGDILVIVDVLRFSTAVAAAVEHGATVYPCLETENVEEVAARIGALPAVRGQAEPGSFSLSPLDYQHVELGTRIALASLNGATCSRCANVTPYLFVAGLVNRAAVAAAVNQLLRTSDLSVSVVACGEQWPDPSPEGRLRFAVEDYLGAGAVLAALEESKSPEAAVCEAAFLGVERRLASLLRECASGRELVERGRGEDVEAAAALDIYQAVPLMRDGVLAASTVLRQREAAGRRKRG